MNAFLDTLVTVALAMVAISLPFLAVFLIAGLVCFVQDRRKINLCLDEAVAQTRCADDQAVTSFKAAITRAVKAGKHPIGYQVSRHPFGRPFVIVTCAEDIVAEAEGALA